MTTTTSPAEFKKRNAKANGKKNGHAKTNGHAGPVDLSGAVPADENVLQPPGTEEGTPLDHGIAVLNQLHGHHPHTNHRGEAVGLRLPSLDEVRIALKVVVAGQCLSEGQAASLLWRYPG